MSKMNRRDYLALMGAGSAGIVAGNGLEALADVRESLTMQANDVCEGASETPALWTPSKSTLPDGQIVKLVFWGLMGFTHLDESTCEVGFHLENDSKHEHQLSIVASSRSSDEFEVIASDVDDDAAMQIQVPDPEPNTFGYYQPTTQVAARKNLGDQDFRWIIDFDSNYLYGKHFTGNPRRKTLQKKSGIHKPKLLIRNGIFYTLRKTASTFRAQTKKGDCVSYLAHVADIIGVNIYLRDGEVTLTVGGINFSTGAPRTIYFINSCSNDGSRCPQEPHNLEDKTLRSDFYMNYHAFNYKKDTLSGTKEYELYLVESIEQSHVPPEATTINNFIRSRLPSQVAKEKVLMSDESPCAATGYGGNQ